MRSRLAVLGAALLALVLAPAARALPGQGSCTLQPGSPPCLTWTGKVTWISDGDTVEVDVDGDGTRAPVTVRFIGIQAMEQSRYSAVASRRRGDCHSVAATDRLEQLLKASHMRVRLAAQDPNAESFGRPWRNVAVRLHGHWRDTGRILLREGLVLAMPNQVEYAWNHDYTMISEEAAQRHVGLFDDHSCGAGPSAGAQLSLRLTWAGREPRGATENLHVGGESVEIDNAGPVAVPLGGWWLRLRAAPLHVPGGRGRPGRRGGHAVHRLRRGHADALLLGPAVVDLRQLHRRRALAGRRRLPVRPAGGPPRGEHLPLPARLLVV